MSTFIDINKTGLTVRVKELPQVSMDFIFNYGIRQILNDCHSSIQAKDFETDDAFRAAVMEKVEAKIAALESGDITTRSASGKATLSPEDKLVLRDAKLAIDKALKLKGVKKAALGDGKYEELVKSYIAKHEESLRKAAKAELKRVAALELVNITDIDALLG